MGQQQLLLLVMGIVIVGIAVIAGFHAFDTKFKQNVADVLVDRNLTIASDAVFWKTKSDPFNGGNAEYSSLADGGMQTLFLGEETEDGAFKITSATSDRLEITAVSSRFPQIGVRTYVRQYAIDSTIIRYDGSISIDG